MENGHRQRLLKKVISGISSLEEHEILEALLFYAIPRKNTNQIAKDLLKVCGGSIINVLNAPDNVLLSVDGIGKNTVAFFRIIDKTVFEIANKPFEKVYLRNLGDVQKYSLELFKDCDIENCYALLLDKKNLCISRCLIGEGCFNSIDVDLTSLSEQIVSYKPASIIICHNHPSGKTEPSYDDNKTTKAIYLLAKVNGATLLDHIIIGKDSYYSYFHSGKLDAIKSEIDNKLN